LFNNPKKKAQSIINKIEKGAASVDNLNDLSEILEKDPSLESEIVEPLISIIKEFNAISFRSAISALNMLADKETGMISDSVDAFGKCLKKDLQTGDILNTLEIMHNINRKYPEKMNTAVPGLFMSLRNMNGTVREKANSVLSSISILHPEFFKAHTKELNLALNGLNLDERIYACKIIKNIANRDPTIVKDMYETLSYLEGNHPSRELRIEAASAIDKMKIKKEVEQPGVWEDLKGPDSKILLVKPGGPLSGTGQQMELAGTPGTLRRDNKDTLKVPAVERIIKRMENIDISSQIEKIIQDTDIKNPVLESVFNIAREISIEGREGKSVGTSFIVGNSKEVLARSKQLIHNPVESIPVNERMITDHEFCNTIKELSQLDGAFVVSGDGLVEAACRFLTADASRVNISGFGTKHFSVAAMTMATKAIGIVVSESGGRITIFKDGKILSSFC